MTAIIDIKIKKKIKWKMMKLKYKKIKKKIPKQIKIYQKKDEHNWKTK